MKKLSNRMKVAFTVICCLGFTLLFNGCKDNDTPPDCGCESETLATVPDYDLQVPIEEQKSGLLFYKRLENVDGFYNDQQYNDRFWIFQGTEGCYNCQRKFIVCDENLLGSEFNYLKSINDSIEVKFTGKLKSLCVLRPIPADFNYAEIILTSIEQQ